jgi:hypothetical protein
MISDALRPLNSMGFAIKRNRVGYFLRIALLVCTPALGFYAVLVYFNYSLADFTPATPNDQLDYFLESQAYCHYGWNAGYFAIGEEPAPAAFSHMGVHGPFFPALYGLLGRCFGLSYRSGPLFNVWILCAAIAVYCWLSRPSGRQVLWLALFFLTYWPCYAFVYSWMQDVLHIAVAVVLAGIFTALLSRTPLSRAVWFRVAAVVFVCGAALLRISWALILPPMFLLFLPRYTSKTVAAALLASGVGILLLMITFRWICAPFSNIPTAFLMNKLLTLDVDPKVLFGHMWTNLQEFRRFYLGVEKMVGYEHLGLLGLFCVLAGLILGARMWSPKGTAFLRRFDLIDRPGETFFCCYNQLVITVATVATYWVGNGGAMRLFSTYVPLALLVVFAGGKRTFQYLFVAVIAFNLLMSTRCLRQVQELTHDSFSYPARTAAFKETIRDDIVFTPGANGWDNTLLTDRVPPEFAGLPPGIGVSTITSYESLARPKSRYILASREVIEKAKTKVRFLRTLRNLGGHLWLAKGADPNLYLNLAPSR